MLVYPQQPACAACDDVAMQVLPGMLALVACLMHGGVHFIEFLLDAKQLGSGTHAMLTLHALIWLQPLSAACLLPECNPILLLLLTHLPIRHKQWLVNYMSYADNVALHSKGFVHSLFGDE